MEQLQEKGYTVWINLRDRIVSFEKQEHFQKLQFSSHEEKLNYVVEKGTSGFRIQ